MNRLPPIKGKGARENVPRGKNIGMPERKTPGQKNSVNRNKGSTRLSLFAKQLDKTI